MQRGVTLSILAFVTARLTDIVCSSRDGTERPANQVNLTGAGTLWKSNDSLPRTRTDVQMKWATLALALAILYAAIMSWLWTDAQQVVAPRPKERSSVAITPPDSTVVASPATTRPQQSLGASPPSTEAAIPRPSVSAPSNGPLGGHTAPLRSSESRRGANEGSVEKDELERAVEKTARESAAAFEAFRALASKP